MIGDRECIDVSIKSINELQTMRDIIADTSRYIVVDVETTGLNPKNDEILQVAICDGLGNELLNSYIMPERRRRWPNAQKVNGITWDMVKDAPTLGEISGRIQALLNSKALVIGYNLRFDFSMLEAGGVDTHIFGYAWDIMNDCSVLMGNWNSTRCEYSYVRLQAIASHYNIQYEPHNALEDARATAKVFRRLLNDSEYQSKVREKEIWLKEADKQAEEMRQERIQAEEKIEKEQKQKSNEAIAALIILILVIVFGFVSCTSTCSSGSRTRTSHTYTTRR